MIKHVHHTAVVPGNFERDVAESFFKMSWLEPLQNIIVPQIWASLLSSLTPFAYSSFFSMLGPCF